MRVFLAILGVAAGVVLLVLLGVAIAVWTVDPRDLVRPVQAYVRDATGRELAIGGNVDLKLGLEPKLVLEDVRIGNAPWGKAPDLARAKRVEAQVALLPLLQRRFDLVRLNLREPLIALETDEHGRGNWELVTRAGKAGDGKAAADAGTMFFVGNIGIENGTLTFRDGATGALTHVAIESLSLTARDAESPVRAEFRGRVDDVAIALAGSLGPLATLAQRRLPYPIALQGEVAGRKAAMSTQVQRGEGVVELKDLDVKSGQSNVKGEIQIREGGRSRMAVRLDAPSLAIEDLPLPPPAAPPTSSAPTGARKAPSRYLFADTEVPLDGLRKRDIEGELTIGRLVLAANRHADAVRVRFTLRGGKLDASSFQASALGGRIDGTLAIDASRGGDAAVTLRAAGRDLDLAALLAAAGRPREVRGGKTQLAIDLSTRGNSPREWASGASGSLRLVVGPASIVSAKADPTQAADRLLQAVNPFRGVDPVTELECAVVRMPLARGVARIERTIAVETRKIGASARGTLDLRNETIDLAIKPQVKQGVALEVPGLADLVRVRGSFLAPEIGIDAAGSAALVARIGAAVSTSGMSMLGESLLARGAPSPCAVALGQATPSETTATPASKAGSAGAEELGKALGRLLGR